MDAGTVVIPSDALARIRARQATITQYQLVLADLQLGLRFELLSLGINIDDGEWELDLERGIVTHREVGDADAVDPAN